MRNQLPSKIEQIEALIRFEACELTEKYTDDTISSEEAYKKIFIIKKKEIKEYIKSKYKMEELINLKKGNLDGFYALHDKSSFLIYEQERGFKFLERKVKNEKAVWKEYVEYLIRHSGTGLSFE